MADLVEHRRAHLVLELVVVGRRQQKIADVEDDACRCSGDRRPAEIAGVGAFEEPERAGIEGFLDQVPRRAQLGEDRNVAELVAEGGRQRCERLFCDIDDKIAARLELVRVGLVGRRVEPKHLEVLADHRALVAEILPHERKGVAVVGVTRILGHELLKERQGGAGTFDQSERVGAGRAHGRPTREIRGDALDVRKGLLGMLVDEGIEPIEHLAKTVFHMEDLGDGDAGRQGRILATRGTTAMSPKKIPVAVQLYPLREEFKQDFAATLAKVKKMGFDGVELWTDWPYKPSEIKKMFSDSGLEVAGYHIAYKLFAPAVLEQTILDQKELGNRYLICPSIPESARQTAQAWIDRAKEFSDIAARLATEGLFTGYHCHGSDFGPLEGKVPWDIFFDHASPDVIMQLDVGNARYGGADPIPYFTKYPGRCRTVHLKDFSEKSKVDVILGQGEMPWRRVLELCETVGNTEWYIIEQESKAHPALECARLSLEFIRKLGR
jgi:sugar phosphate isomerase/epimerase